MHICIFRLHLYLNDAVFLLSQLKANKHIITAVPQPFHCLTENYSNIITCADLFYSYHHIYHLLILYFYTFYYLHTHYCDFF